MLGAAFDHSMDIWNFGCLMYEFFTQQPLFTVWQSTWLPQYRTNDSHLLQIIDALGPLPDSLFNLWERGGRYFGPDGKVLRTDVGEEEPCPYPIYIGPNLEEMFVQNRMLEMDEDEASVVVALLRKILALDKEDRPTTAQLLEEAWFQAIEVE